MISPSKFSRLVILLVEFTLHLFIHFWFYNFPMLIPYLEVVISMKLLFHRQPMRARSHQVEIQSPRPQLPASVPNLPLGSLHP